MRDPTTYYDSKGRPIEMGDLVRSHHFGGGRPGRKKYYLYHLVTQKEGRTKIESTKWFVTQHRDHKCDCLLSQDIADTLTILDECEAEDRPRRVEESQHA